MFELELIQYIFFVGICSYVFTRVSIFVFSPSDICSGARAYI